MSRAQLWRQTKQQRAAEWAAFNASQPDETYDAPEDIAALQQASATVGDFKLKSSPGFMLPEVGRMFTGHTHSYDCVDAEFWGCIPCMGCRAWTVATIYNATLHVSVYWVC
jgi:hypothetical protein